MPSPNQTVEVIRAIVKALEKHGRRDITIRLGPYHYEQLLIAKGLPHGLGILTQWGPYQDQRPIFAPYPLTYIGTGKSHVAAIGAQGETETYGVSDGKRYFDTR